LAAALNYTLGAMKAASTLVIALKLVVSAAFLGSFAAGRRQFSPTGSRWLASGGSNWTARMPASG